MNEKRERWERPDFQEHPLGAEVTAYLSSPIREPKL
jgi:coenzyme PQQ precursor peptide PqqA